MNENEKSNVFDMLVIRSPRQMLIAKLRHAVEVGKKHVHDAGHWSACPDLYLKESLLEYFEAEEGRT